MSIAYNELLQNFKMPMGLLPCMVAHHMSCALGTHLMYLSFWSLSGINGFGIIKLMLSQKTRHLLDVGLE